jgi:hypothetical protein
MTSTETGREYSGIEGLAGFSILSRYIRRGGMRTIRAIEDDDQNIIGDRSGPDELCSGPKDKPTGAWPMDQNWSGGRNGLWIGRLRTRSFDSNFIPVPPEFTRRQIGLEDPEAHNPRPGALFISAHIQLILFGYIVHPDVHEQAPLNTPAGQQKSCRISAHCEAR